MPCITSVETVASEVVETLTYPLIDASIMRTKFAHWSSGVIPVRRSTSFIGFWYRLNLTRATVKRLKFSNRLSRTFFFKILKSLKSYFFL